MGSNDRGAAGVKKRAGWMSPAFCAVLVKNLMRYSLFSDESNLITKKSCVPIRVFPVQASVGVAGYVDIVHRINLDAVSLGRNSGHAPLGPFLYCSRLSHTS